MVHDGITMGPFKRRRYEDLTDHELRENALYAQRGLDRIERNARCGWQKYADQNYTWSQIAQIDPSYYDWARDELESMAWKSQAELNVREKAQQPPPPPPSRAIEPPPLYSEQERKEIIAEGFITDWRDWAHRGWKSAGRNYHPDTGGSHEAWLRHNRGKELFDRLLNDVERELKE